MIEAPLAAWQFAEQEYRRSMHNKLKIICEPAVDIETTPSGGRTFQWSFGIESVDGSPIKQEMRDGDVFYNGYSLSQIKREAERMCMERVYQR